MKLNSANLASFRATKMPIVTLATDLAKASVWLVGVAKPLLILMLTRPALA